MISDILKIAGIYTAVILGAGFASGQELMTFFVKYGKTGFIGLFISGIIFGLVGYEILDFAHKKKIDQTPDFIKFLFGKSYFLIDFANNIFLFVLYFTMLSATGATLKQEFNLPYISGILIMASLCLVTCFLGTNFIANINFIVSPILFIGSIFIGLYAILNQKFISVIKIYDYSWLKSALLYPTYNIITAISVLIPMSNTIKNKKYGKYGAFLGGIVMTILGIISSVVIYLNYQIANQTQIPMLAITNKFSCYIKYIYFIIFILAVYSTAVGNFFGLYQIRRNFKSKLKQNLYIFLIIISAIILANIKFSNLISKIYPIFGYICLFEIIFLSLFYFYCYMSNDIKI